MPSTQNQPNKQKTHKQTHKQKPSLVIPLDTDALSSKFLVFGTQSDAVTASYHIGWLCLCHISHFR